MTGDGSQAAFDDEFDAIVAGLEHTEVRDGPAGDEPCFRLNQDGSLAVQLPYSARRCLANLVEQHATLLADDGWATSGLYPVAHTDDLGAQMAFADRTRGIVRDGHIDAVVACITSAFDDVWSADTADAWLRTLQGVRVVLAGKDPTVASVAGLQSSGTTIGSLFGLCAYVIDEIVAAGV